MEFIAQFLLCGGCKNYRVNVAAACCNGRIQDRTPACVISIMQVTRDKWPRFSLSAAPAKRNKNPAGRPAGSLTEEDNRKALSPPSGFGEPEDQRLATLPWPAAAAFSSSAL
jgi:hypothetical protein